MISFSSSPNWGARLRVSLGGLFAFVIIGAACGSDGTAPSTEAALPADPTGAAPAADTITTLPVDTTTTPDSTGLPPIDSTAPGELIEPAADGSLTGIAFGSTAMLPSYLTTVHTGTLLGGPLSPKIIVPLLTETRNKRGRMVIKLCKGSDRFVKNSDGTFSLTKWKALVDQYRNVNLAPFIDDGTILGHYLIDEPHRAVRWGGKIISQSTIEEMAAYSKGIWRTMPALVRVVPSWLAASEITYTHLDAGWFQYTANKGNVTQLVAAEVAAAKRKRLGLVVGMNVVAGGNGSSGIRGVPSGWAMSATELRTYGGALLSQSYVCGHYMWNHTPSYFARADIKAAMTELSAKAGIHARTSCQQ